jgi:hypothetical protein
MQGTPTQNLIKIKLLWVMTRHNKNTLCLATLKTVRSCLLGIKNVSFLGACSSSQSAYWNCSICVCMYASINQRTAKQFFMKSHTKELIELCQCIPVADAIGQWSVPEQTQYVKSVSPVCKSLYTYQNKKCFEQKLKTQIRHTFMHNTLCQSHGFWDKQTGGKVSKLLQYMYIF